MPIWSDAVQINESRADAVQERHKLPLLWSAALRMHAIKWLLPCLERLGNPRARSRGI